MTNLVSWNIRGLNWPNKQEEVKIFQCTNKVGLLGLLETKIKLSKVDSIGQRMFPNWRWHYNFQNNPKGRIWLLWNPTYYSVEILATTDQLIHGRVKQLHSKNCFLVTVVYGMNSLMHRQRLWDDLIDICPNDEAWCIFGDFNAVRSLEDRIGGDLITDQELQELNLVMNSYVLHEPSTVGSYYTWTNRRIWSKIDRVLINDHWHDTFYYTFIQALPMGISDHTPMMVQFVPTPKPKTGFQYCNMWSSHPDFPCIIQGINETKADSMSELYKLLDVIKAKLRRLHKNKFADLREQQLKAREVLEEA